MGPLTRAAHGASAIALGLLAVVIDTLGRWLGNLHDEGLSEHGH